jgi:hypothetical protein
MFAFILLSCAQIENVIVPESVKPPEGTRPEIHSSTEPPAVFVHWICVPDAAVSTTPVVEADDPAVVDMSRYEPMPFSVVSRRKSLVAMTALL